MEIKFRGKRVDNGEWVYGCYGEYFSHNTQEHYHYIETIKKDAVGYEYNQRYMINPETVRQYTNLKDKNGVEIYEGDIIQYHPEANAGVGSVVYQGSGFYVIDEFNGLLDDFATLGVEVIGNIHEEGLR